MQNSTPTQLYDLLITRDFEPKLKDAMGKDVIDPSESDMFTFDWKTQNKNYGTVVILIGQDRNLKIFFGDNLGRTMESNDKSDWYEFLNQLKQFTVRNNLMNFDIENINRLKYNMQGIAAIKEGLFEGYYGNKKISYSDQPKQTRLVIKHNRTLGEGDARFRYVESLFVETGDDQRFKLPFTNLIGGRAMARHVSEGGTPYDAFGQHICEIVKEMNILGKFVRASKHKNFDGDAGTLAETAIRHYQDLKSKAKRIISQRGYLVELENFDPAHVSEADAAAEDIRNMFIEQSLDSRIEEAIPLLAKLSVRKDNNMKEIAEFESWANTVTEGTWATPDNPESESKLQQLMSQELPVGADATNATEQLYDILGDDQLFDQLIQLADTDADADARPLIQARLAELGINIEMPADTVEKPDDPAAADTPPTDVPAPAAPPVDPAASPTDVPNLDPDAAPQTQPQPQPTAEDLDVDGVMMTKQSNMSSESVERVIRLAQLLR
jgi:hypothetical protein